MAAARWRSGSGGPARCGGAGAAARRAGACGPRRPARQPLLALAGKLDAPAEPAVPQPAPAPHGAARTPLPAAAAAGAASAAAAAAAAVAGNGAGPAPAAPPAAPPAPAAPGAAAAPSTGWYAAVGLSAVAALICSVDRAAISVAILPMSEQYGWSDGTKGAINSAFYIGYTLTNLVGGYLASSLSAKGVLGAGVVVWSAFTISTPAAAGAGLPLLLANRAMMGAGEGVTFPCVQNIVKFWCPPDVRTRALTLIYSGGQLGTIVALVTAPLIINAFGWPAVFEIFGSLGLVWIVFWQRLVSDTPPPPAPLGPAAPAKQQQQLAQGAPPAAAAAGGAVAQQQSQQPPQSQQSPQVQQPGPPPLPAAAAAPQQASLTALPRLRDIPWRSFFTNRAFLAIMMAHSAFGVGHYVCLSWLPTYYNQEFGVDVQQSALLSVLPWFVTVLVSNSSGWVADWLANSGRLSMTNTRKLMQTAGAVGPALCLLYLALAHEDPGELQMGEAVGLMTATLSLGGLQSAGFASNHQDLASRYAAVLFGITNALSSLMGTLSVYATGLVLDASGSWELVFEGVAVCYLLGAVGYAALASAEPQFE
ncbi:PHT4 [Scenedesmus sp. PABB004]|nr:PHT4 [Scenedesmus sp. PABB004]